MTRCDLHDHDFHHAVILSVESSNVWKPEAVKALLDNIGHLVHVNVEVHHR